MLMLVGGNSGTKKNNLRQITKYLIHPLINVFKFNDRFPTKGNFMRN